MFGEKRIMKFFYTARLGGAMTGKPSNATLCRECGKCVEKCPQDLAIPELLKDVAKEFEGLWFRPMVVLLKIGVTLQSWWTMHRPRRRR
jgi:hypothetical protein